MNIYPALLGTMRCDVTGHYKYFTVEVKFWFPVLQVTPFNINWHPVKRAHDK